MATAESKPQKTIVLKSSDGDCFVVEESAAILSVTIRNMIEEDCADGPIPLPNVSSKILSKVIEYCKRHAEPTAEPEPEANHLPGGEIVDNELNKFDSEFVKVDQGTLFELVLAANYLDVKKLLELTSKSVADVIKDKSVEEVRKIFNIVNDFTPEEEAEIRRENAWAFEEN